MEVKEYLAPSGWPTPSRMVRKMIELADPKPGETLYDIGCGDGRFLVEASKAYGIRSVGIECDEKLATKARENVKKNNLENLATVINDDVFNRSLKDADIVTLYLVDEGMELLRGKLTAELPENSRIISHWYEFKDLKPTEYRWMWSGVRLWPPLMPFKVILRYDAKDLRHEV